MSNFTHLHRHMPCIIAPRLMPNGYPTSQRHRKVLEEKLGRKLLPGCETHHLCENPGCIEAQHLQEWTMREHRAYHLLQKPRGQRTGPNTDEWKENISLALRGRSLSPVHRASLSRGQRNRTDRRNKLAVEQEQEIRDRVGSGEKYRSLAAEYGISVSTVNNVLRRG